MSYTFEVRDRAIHLVYTTEQDVDERIQRVLEMSNVDANIIERKMSSHVMETLGGWKYELDNGQSRIAVVSTSIYLAHLLLCADTINFQYPIYFIKVGRSVRNSTKDEMLYSWFDVRDIASRYDNVSSIREAISILF